MNHLALVHETSVSLGVVSLTRMPNVMGSTLAVSYSFNMPMEISSELKILIKALLMKRFVQFLKHSYDSC